MEVCYVLSYKYSDGSGGSVVRVYLAKDKEKAEADHSLLMAEASDCKSWYLSEVPVY